MSDAKQRIELVRELDKVATRAPWGSGYESEAKLVWSDGLAGQTVATCASPQDALFIAQARSLLPALAADLEQALAREAALRIERDEERRMLGAIMGFESSDPDKAPSLPALETEARGLKILADQAGQESSNLWKMVSAAVGDRWKSHIGTGYSPAMALCAAIAAIKHEAEHARRLLVATEKQLAAIKQERDAALADAAACRADRDIAIRSLERRTQELLSAEEMARWRK